MVPSHRTLFPTLMILSLMKLLQEQEESLTLTMILVTSTQASSPTIDAPKKLGPLTKGQISLHPDPVAPGSLNLQDTIMMMTTMMMTMRMTMMIMRTMMMMMKMRMLVIMIMIMMMIVMIMMRIVMVTMMMMMIPIVSFVENIHVVMICLEQTHIEENHIENIHVEIPGVMRT